MMFHTKYVSLRYIHNNFYKSFFILGLVLVLSILLIRFSKSSSVVHQDTTDSTSIKFVSSSKNSETLTFPQVVKEFKATDRKFVNENARLVGFFGRGQHTRNTTRQYDSHKIIYLATKYFNEFNPKHYYFLHYDDATFKRYQCPINSCYVTNRLTDISRSHAVLFHVRDLEVFSLPPYRSPEQIWIIYSMEPPWLEIRDMKRFNGIFNWTMSYRRDSDVSVAYGFVGKRPQADPANINDYELDNIFRKKANKAVWYVSNCETDSNREEYIAHLRKFYPVDIIGGCSVEGCRPAETMKCYKKIANDYKFYIAFENAICRDYVTEKLFNSLDYYIIPITFGGANYSEMTPRNSIINAMEFTSPEELGHFLWEVSINKILYLSYFEWKKTHRSYLQPWMCDLCEKLHHPAPIKTEHNLDTWWNEGESCLRWSTEGLKPVTKHAFPHYHKTKYFAA